MATHPKMIIFKYWGKKYHLTFRYSGPVTYMGKHDGSGYPYLVLVAKNPHLCIRVHVPGIGHLSNCVTAMTRLILRYMLRI
jgi:hypothetical protein